ncbi:hypothetical protein PVK06_011876 [Gossypium arboreum]|uniref:Uncharacterized protein n=1 Tax=Gossypium arboreum TaxID=29729 RepID=A0ABR0QB60_GOSAR|nr:hypothetical protein PVK06_011876 [Gossypium arboreum]
MLSLSSNKTLCYGTFISHIFRTLRINVSVDLGRSINSFIDILTVHSCNWKLDDKGNYVRKFDWKSSVAQASTVPSITLQTSNAPRHLHEAYPALIALPSPCTTHLLQAINGLSLQIDAHFNALTAHFNGHYNQLDDFINRWTSIGRTQDGKTLKRLQNSTGRTGSSINTTRTSIGRMHSSVQGSFDMKSLPIPWSDQSIQLDFYRYLKDFYQDKSRQ